MVYYLIVYDVFRFNPLISLTFLMVTPLSLPIPTPTATPLLLPVLPALLVLPLFVFLVFFLPGSFGFGARGRRVRAGRPG